VVVGALLADWVYRRPHSDCDSVETGDSFSVLDVSMRVKIGEVAKAFMSRQIGCIYIKVESESEAGYTGTVMAYDLPWKTKRIGDKMTILKVQVVDVLPA